MNRSDKTIQVPSKDAGELGRRRARFGAIDSLNLPNTEYSEKNEKRA